ncbi:cation:proton antiporter [Rubripirellula sp.]|nr:cation:proton antiporter [Rubripirellula sp.]MDB4749957.1 cation:proton antiporter [Rubripirellula sp.]
MSEYQILAVIAAFVFAYCLVAARLERTQFNGPLVYVACGLMLGPYCLKMVSIDVDGETLKTLAELTLAVVLFTDSAGANLPVLRRIKRLPARLLLIGLPLTIALGFFSGSLLYSNLSWIELALLATMLAPTDAALGQAVINNEAVPNSVREGLNVESGLNDGICVPVLLLFLAISSDSLDQGTVLTQMLELPLQAIGIGAVVGIASALIGCSSINASIRRDWIDGAWTQIPVIALAIVCFAISQWLGGSGFIACFVGGLFFGGLIREQKQPLLKAADGTGDVLSMITWFIFGALFIGDCLMAPEWRAIVYALLSLSVVRMIPVFLSVLGMGLQTDSKLFMGWFGPRGLASIVFIVMVNEANLPGSKTLVQAVTWTVLLSVILHGTTANPFANAYAKRVKARGETV